MSMDILKRELKENAIRRLYLFYGPEAYLVRHYAGEIERRIVSEPARAVSYSMFEGKPDLERIHETCQAYPLFGDRRMVVVKDSGLLKAQQSGAAGESGGGDGVSAGDGGVDDGMGASGVDAGGGNGAGGNGMGDGGDNAAAATDAGRKTARARGSAKGSAKGAARGAAGPAAITFETIVSSLPDTACLLIIEKDVDRRMKLYGLISKAGLAVEFPLQQPAALEKWVASIVARSGKQFERGALAYFMEKSEESMTAIKSELDKLLLYVGERSRITTGDIAAVCSFSLKARIFDLMDSVVSGQSLKAMAELHALAEQREPATKIMIMLSGHLVLLRHMKMMALGGKQLNEITEIMKLNPYRAKILWRQCRRCQPQLLEAAVRKCYEQDLAVKSGRLDKDAALELLVASLL